MVDAIAVVVLSLCGVLSTLMTPPSRMGFARDLDLDFDRDLDRLDGGGNVGGGGGGAPTKYWI